MTPPGASAAVPAAPPGRVSGKLLLAVLGTIAGLGILFAVVGQRLVPPLPDLPSFGPVPALALTDEQGRPFGNDRLAGRVVIVNFLFTACPTVCPTLAARMASVQRELSPHGDRVHLVSITVDPANDTPERLREYGTRFGQDPAHWSFLTGDIAAIKAAAEQGFKVALEPAAAAVDIVHSEHFILVDTTGEIRGYYRAEKPELTRMTMDVSRLLQEADRAKGTKR